METEENLIFDKIEKEVEKEQKIRKTKKINLKSQTRKVKVPFHRLNPLKKNWPKIIELIADKMKLLI